MVEDIADLEKLNNKTTNVFELVEKRTYAFTFAKDKKITGR